MTFEFELSVFNWAQRVRQREFPLAKREQPREALLGLVVPNRQRLSLSDQYNEFLAPGPRRSSR